MRLFQLHYCKWLIIDHTHCGSRFSTVGLLAFEDFTLVLLLLCTRITLQFVQSVQLAGPTACLKPQQLGLSANNMFRQGKSRTGPQTVF